MDSINYLRLFTAIYEPVRGKSYIATPESIAGKRAVVNIHNEDERCFEYAILASQHYPWIDQSHAKRPGQYTQWLDTLKFDGCETPMALDDITKFEKQNKLSINVFHILHKGKTISPLRITHNDVRLENMVNLLLIEGELTTH